MIPKVSTTFSLLKGTQICSLHYSLSSPTHHLHIIIKHTTNPTSFYSLWSTPNPPPNQKYKNNPLYKKHIPHTLTTKKLITKTPLGPIILNRLCFYIGFCSVVFTTKYIPKKPSTARGGGCLIWCVPRAKVEVVVVQHPP